MFYKVNVACVEKNQRISAHNVKTIKIVIVHHVIQDLEDHVLWNTWHKCIQILYKITNANIKSS